MINSREPSKFLIITTQNNFIFTRLFHSDSIIRKRLRGVEIEYEKEAGTFKHYYLVTL
jgi:hypothetical protein